MHIYVFRLALDAVHRAHKEEMRSLVDKLRETRLRSEALERRKQQHQSDSSTGGDLDQPSSNGGGNGDLAQLSAMYTAKCMETEQLEARLQQLLLQCERGTDKRFYLLANFFL
jgi:hypothetical protein